MRNLLSELQLTELQPDNSKPNQGWMLLPMTSTDLTATNLGDILTDILKRTRALPLHGKQPGKVVYLGMDSPELPVEEIVGCIANSRESSLQEAVLCPANDGGYGMLAVPPQAPTNNVFPGIRWSDPLTALGQLKVLTDGNIPVKLGRLMNDVDETEDVKALCKRLGQVGEDGSAAAMKADVLLKSSPSSGVPQTGLCHHTRQVLKDINLLP